MTMKTLWSKIEAGLWTLASVYLIYFILGWISSQAKTEEWMQPRSHVYVLVVVSIWWWIGFKNRLAKFLRESLRRMDRRGTASEPDCIRDVVA